MNRDSHPEPGTSEHIPLDDHSYRAITRDISVTVEPEYLENQSDPEDAHYVWAYHIRIENHGEEIVHLLTRYWRITDSQGRIQEVNGDGVVGEQPILGPGDWFEYSSGTPLPTASGFMSGHYSLIVTSEGPSKGDRFDVEIPAFSLDTPQDLDVVH